MGLCIDCKYHSIDDTERPPRPRVPFNRHPRHLHHVLRPWLLPGFYDSDHKCLSPDNYETDFVTGDGFFPSCYSKNRFEECPYWEPDEDSDMPDKVEPDVPSDSGQDTPSQDEPSEGEEGADTPAAGDATTDETPPEDTPEEPQP